MPEREEVGARYLCREKLLQEFKESIKGIENLNCPMDNEFLLKFLAARKYRLSEALKLLKRYFEVKKQNMQLLSCVCPLNLSHFFNIDQQVIVLKHRDHLGRKVLIQRNGLWNPDLLSLDQIIVLKYYIMEEVLNCPETQNNGVVVISDDNGLNFDLNRRYLYEMTYKRLRLILNFIQGSFPGQFKGIHIVNNNYVSNIIFNIMRPFLSEKMRKRFFVHGSKLENLHDYVSPNILPTHLGGKLRLEDAYDTQLMNNLFSKGSYYKKMLEFGYTDTARH